MFDQRQPKYTNPGFCQPSSKSAWDLVYPGQKKNHDVGETLRNSIGCLVDWELEKTDFSLKIKTPDWCIRTEDINQGTLVCKTNCSSDQ